MLHAIAHLGSAGVLLIAPDDPAVVDAVSGSTTWPFNQPPSVLAARRQTQQTYGPAAVSRLAVRRRDGSPVVGLGYNRGVGEIDTIARSPGQKSSRGSASR
jgi:hypothetical protein